MMCPLCADDEETYVVENIPHGRKRIACRHCNYEWDLGEVAIGSQLPAPNRPSRAPREALGHGDGPTTTYKRLKSVGRTSPEGIELTLAMQSRTSLLEDEPTWLTLSWRTRLHPGGPNRRFYMQDGVPWEISAPIALEMLEAMEALGGLDDEHRDRRSFDTVAVTHVSSHHSPINSAIFEEITWPSEQWGAAPFWLAIDEAGASRHGGRWRKCLILDRERGRATIRSMTTSTEYQPRKILGRYRDWHLDNSMPDISVQQARVILEHLRDLLL